MSAIEKEVATKRILKDSIQNMRITWSWKEGISEFKTIHPYIRMFLGITHSCLLTSNSSFLAIIVARLGYDTVKTNLYTVAPSLVACVALIGTGYSSDYFRERGFHCATPQAVSVIGYIILLVVDTKNTAVTYFAIFITTIGVRQSSTTKPSRFRY